jgi:fucose permease
MFVYVGVEVGAGQWSYTRFVADGALDDGTAALAVFLYWFSLAAGRVLLAVFGDRVSPSRLFDLSVFGALAASVAFWVLPPLAAALVALPLIGLALSVFVPVLMYLMPRRVGSADAARAIGYLGAAGTVGGAAFPSVIGLVMQGVAVAALGPCLVVLTVALAGLHVASTRSARSALTPTAAS